MPRIKPLYQWPLTEGKPLKNEPSTKRTAYKQGGKKFKQSTPPAQLPSCSVGQSDVHYGSHKAVSKQVEQERARLKL